MLQKTRATIQTAGLAYKALLHRLGPKRESGHRRPSVRLPAPVPAARAFIGYSRFKAASLSSTSRLPMPRSAAMATKACALGFALPASQA